MQQRNYILSRFFRIMIPLCLSVFIGSIAIYEYYNFSRESQALEHRLDQLGSTYALLYAEPVNSGSLDRIQAITIALISDSDIVEVVIRDTGNRVLEEFTTGYDPDAALAKTIRINHASESGYGPIGLSLIHI